MNALTRNQIWSAWLAGNFQAELQMFMTECIRLQIVKDWLKEEKVVMDTSRFPELEIYVCSHVETITALEKVVFQQMTQLLTEDVSAEEDLVDKFVKVVDCQSFHHVGDNNCLCRLKGKTVKITASIGGGLYRIKETDRAIARKEFELLPELPAESPVTTETEKILLDLELFDNSAVRAFHLG